MADTPITVREVAEADLPTLEQHDPVPAEHSARAHYAGATASDQMFVAGYLDGQPAGWAVLDCTDESFEPLLAHMWVFPESRRQGVGRALSEWIESTARERGYEEIFLMVDPDNGKAVPLWMDLGYRPTGEHALGIVVESGEQTHQAVYRKSLKQI